MAEKIRAKDGHGDISKEKSPLKPARTKLERYLKGTKSIHVGNICGSLLNTNTQSRRKARIWWKN